MARLNHLNANKLNDYQILKLTQAGCLQRNILSGDLKDPISVIFNALAVALWCLVRVIFDEMSITSDRSPKNARAFARSTCLCFDLLVR